MSIIKLKSSDGDIFETDVQVAKCSGTIKTMLEYCGLDDEEDTLVPLPNVNSNILRRILQWANHHKDDRMPAEHDVNKELRTDDISTWDANFLNVDRATLFDLISAANYLDIKGLMDVTAKTLANMIKESTPAEVRRTFNIGYGAIPAKEGQVRNENK